MQCLRGSNLINCPRCTAQVASSIRGEADWRSLRIQATAPTKLYAHLQHGSTASTAQQPSARTAPTHTALHLLHLLLTCSPPHAVAHAVAHAVPSPVSVPTRPPHAPLHYLSSRASRAPGAATPSANLPGPHARHLITSFPSPFSHQHSGPTWLATKMRLSAPVVRYRIRNSYEVCTPYIHTYIHTIRMYEYVYIHTCLSVLREPVPWSVDQTLDLMTFAAGGGHHPAPRPGPAPQPYQLAHRPTPAVCDFFAHSPRRSTCLVSSTTHRTSPLDLISSLTFPPRHFVHHLCFYCETLDLSPGNRRQPPSPPRPVRPSARPPPWPRPPDQSSPTTSAAPPPTRLPPTG